MSFPGIPRSLNSETPPWSGACQDPGLALSPWSLTILHSEGPQTVGSRASDLDLPQLSRKHGPCAEVLRGWGGELRAGQQGKGLEPRPAGPAGGPCAQSPALGRKRWGKLGGEGLGLPSTGSGSPAALGNRPLTVN